MTSSTAAKKKKIDPFKTKKTKEVPQGATDTISPPEDVAQAIDAFRECQEQAKHFEGEATVHKDLITEFARREYTKRIFSGMPGSFKLLGDETMVTYVVMDSSAGLTEEDVEVFSKRWGKKAAEDLIEKDFRSIRFDADVLAANYDAIVDALQTLPGDILEKLFKPMSMKAKSAAVETAKKHVKNADELKELLEQLKLKNYIR